MNKHKQKSCKRQLLKCWNFEQGQLKRLFAKIKRTYGFLIGTHYVTVSCCNVTFRCNGNKFGKYLASISQYRLEWPLPHRILKAYEAQIIMLLLNFETWTNLEMLWQIMLYRLLILQITIKLEAVRLQSLYVIHDYLLLSTMNAIMAHFVLGFRQFCNMSLILGGRRYLVNY